MDGNQNKILELLAPDLQTKSRQKGRRRNRERAKEKRRAGRGGLLDRHTQSEAEAGHAVQVSEHKMPPPLCGIEI